MSRKWGALLLFSVVLMALSAAPGYSQQIITNGSGLYLGINPEGHLNVPNGSGGVTVPGGGEIGLFLAGVGDATSPGCLCEGWGVGVNGGASVGYASVDLGGISNLTLVSFTHSSTTATSVVHLTSLPGLTVTQVYSASSSPNLFQDVVTVTNTTGSTVTGLRYERTMDWDIPPTEFNEFVTLQGWPASALIHTSDDGFHTPNPFVLSSSICAGAPDNANFTDAGPCDHGADFVFESGSLANGESKSLTIFYGAASNEAGALAALGAVGAEVYSLGQSTTPAGGPANGAATFIFGFKGVGGTPVPPTVPEPTSLVLLGAGLTGLTAMARKKNRK